MATRKINSYRKGYKLELLARDYYRQKGCFVIRQAKSSFPDLIVISPNKHILFVECKWNGKLSKEEFERAQELKPFFDEFIVFSRRKKETK